MDSRGAQTTVDQALDAFSKVHINNRVDVVFMKDSSDYATIEYGENVIGGIDLKVEDGVLHINENNRCDWIRKVRPLPRIEVHYTSLSEIDSKNAGSISFNEPFTDDSLQVEIKDVSGDVQLDVACEYLGIVQHTGATDIIARGTVTELYVYNSGYAPIHAEELVARVAGVHSDALSDTYVRAWETLFAQIFHRGNIYLYGIAETVIWHKEGDGQIFRAGD